MTDLDIRDDEKSNGGGDSSDFDAENSTNKRDNDKEEIDPYIHENLLLDDSDDEPTEHHDGADEALAQLINMNQEERRSLRMKN